MMVTRERRRAGRGTAGCERRNDCEAVRAAASDSALKAAGTEAVIDAIDHLAEGFAVFGPDDRLLACNERLRAFYPGIAHLLVPGVPFADIEFAFVGCADSKPAPVDGQRRAGPRRPMRNVELLSCHGRWLLINEHPTANGGLVGIHTDITELKRREQTLARSRQQAREAKVAAERANRGKSEFLANISHELRTPLNAILGFTEAMRMQIFGPLGDARYNDYLGDVHGSAEHLLSLINDLLDLSKLEAGRMELDEEVVDIGEAVAAAIRLIERQAARASVTVACDVPVPAPTIRADGRKLRQVLINLLGNACKFTPAGGLVKIRAETAAKGLRLRIQDNGIGMSRDDLIRALEPFGQAAPGRRHQGTGLGLPLARRLVELHGGSLRLDSRPGHGTTVTVELPPSRCLVEVAA